MRREPGRHALRYGLIGSALLHLAVLALNPAFDASAPRRPQPRVVVPADALRAVELEAAQRAARAGAAVAASVRVSPGDVDSTLARVPAAGTATTSAPDRRTLTALERLAAARDPEFWRAPALEPETREQRALRELAGRLAKAGEEGVAEARERDRWKRIGKVGGVEVIGGGGDVGIRIPFGFRPPPPAQVIAAPTPLTRLAGDSVRHRGERVYAYHGEYAIVLPARVEQGETFDVSAHYPRPVDDLLVRIFVDGTSHVDAITTTGVARASLRIDTSGEHQIRVHFLGNAQLRPVEILYLLLVETAPGAP